MLSLILSKNIGSKVNSIKVEPVNSNKYSSRKIHTAQSIFESKLNLTIVNFVPGGKKYVIQRLGKFDRIENPGMCIVIPFIEKIAYVINTTELCIKIDPQTAITSDNVHITLSGNVYVKFNDVEKAAYGADRPFYAISQFAQSVMRTAVGTYKMNDLFQERSQLNNIVKSALDDGVSKWGAEVLRFEVTELKPTDKRIDDSMTLQAISERQRTETITNSHAYREEHIIKAEGDLMKTKQDADAYLYKQQKLAEAEYFKVVQASDAHLYQQQKMAEAIRVIAEAQACAEQAKIIRVKETLNTDEGFIALKAKILSEQIEASKSLHHAGTVVIDKQNLGDVTSMIGVIGTLLKK